MSAQDRFWRTLLHVTHVDDAIVRFTLPGWSSRETITRPRALFPEPIQSALATDLRIHVEVNIGVEEASELRFQAPWEWDGHTVEQQRAGFTKTPLAIGQHVRVQIPGNFDNWRNFEIVKLPPDGMAKLKDLTVGYKTPYRVHPDFVIPITPDEEAHRLTIHAAWKVDPKSFKRLRFPCRP